MILVHSFTSEETSLLPFISHLRFISFCLISFHYFDNQWVFSSTVYMQTEAHMETFWLSREELWKPGSWALFGQRAGKDRKFHVLIIFQPLLGKAPLGLPSWHFWLPGCVILRKHKSVSLHMHHGNGKCADLLFQRNTGLPHPPLNLLDGSENL